MRLVRRLKTLTLFVIQVWKRIRVTQERRSFFFIMKLKKKFKMSRQKCQTVVSRIKLKCNVKNKVKSDWALVGVCELKARL